MSLETYAGSSCMQSWSWAKVLVFSIDVVFVIVAIVAARVYVSKIRVLNERIACGLHGACALPADVRAETSGNFI